MNNLLAYPASCLVDRPIPKTAFYKNVEVSERMRRRFIDEVQEFRWIYKLAPETLNVERGKDIAEIQLFYVTLKQPAIPTDLLQFIDKSMPQFIIYVLQYENRYCLVCNYKRFATQDHTRCEIIDTFFTEWKRSVPVLNIQGRTLSAIYDNFVRQIAGARLDAQTTLAEDVAIMQVREATLRRIAQLEAQMHKETQPHRKFELHQQIIKLKEELK